MITGQLDTRQFNEALRLYYRTVPKDLAYCTNRSALNVVIKTVKRTPKSDQAKILASLGQTGTKVRQLTKGKNKGKFKADGRIFAGGSSARNLVQWARWKKGLPPLGGAELQAEMSKLTGRRMSSIGYLRSGWIPSIKVLSALKLKLRAEGSELREARRFKNPKGRAIVATPGLKPFALIANGTKWSSVASKALQDGLNEAAADMTKFCKETMGASAKKFSAR